MSIPLLRISELRVTVENNILKESVSFVVEPGKVLRITGRNGTGKTTLLKTILGIHPHSMGEICFNIPTTLGDAISYFPQSWGDTLLPWMDAWENIIVGALNSRNASLNNSLGKLSCQFFPELSNKLYVDNKTPHGILAFKKHLTGLNVTRLSGGQQEKLIILRTLICNPRLLFLDEPYRDLDYESTKAVNDFLQHFVEQGNSVVYVSHQNVGLTPSVTLSMD